MSTIARVVEKIIEEKPFLQEALSRGIVNHAALAEEIIPEIEKELKKKIKFSAVNMAIRRLSEKLNKTFIARTKFDKYSDITIKSDLVSVTLYKIEDIESKIKKFYDNVDFRNGGFVTITQGINEVMIITNIKYKKDLEKIFQEKNIKKIINGLSSITIKVPLSSIDTIGLFYTITRSLNWDNINIIDIVSTLTEMTFIIKEQDTAKAFNCLKKLIKEQS